MKIVEVTHTSPPRQSWMGRGGRTFLVTPGSPTEPPASLHIQSINIHILSAFLSPGLVQSGVGAHAPQPCPCAKDSLTVSITPDGKPTATHSLGQTMGLAEYMYVRYAVQVKTETTVLLIQGNSVRSRNASPHSCPHNAISRLMGNCTRAEGALRKREELDLLWAL